MIWRVLLFLLLNFAALGIGGFFTGSGVPSEWYVQLNKAPWTPPGWVFGAAWTTIMVCFSVYMAVLYPRVDSVKYLIGIYAVQWALNVAWNPIFFSLHQVGLAMIVITALCLLLMFMFWHFKSAAGWWSALLLPYIVWLIIATSLNGYAWLYNASLSF
jgi:benzodiazapine receptor